MLVEPIGSAMSYQAQAAAPQPVTKAEQTNTDGQSVVAESPQVDAKTLAVEKTQENSGEKNDDGRGENNGQQVDNELIRQAMKELNKKATNVTAEFGIHEGTHRITIKMVDKETKKVIKELPPEKTLDMIAKVWEYSGLIVDEKR